LGSDDIIEFFNPVKYIIKDEKLDKKLNQKKNYLQEVAPLKKILTLLIP